MLGQAIAGRMIKGMLYQLLCCKMAHQKLLELDFGHYAKPCLT